jgi:hypothetical protein
MLGRKFATHAPQIIRRASAWHHWQVREEVGSGKICAGEGDGNAPSS